MKITVNNIVTLDTRTKLVSLLENSDTNVELSESATYLFRELLLNNNSIVSREDLLKNVWEKRGYRSSNSSLNNNIHAIRKAYHDLTGESIELKTIPKVGFEMSCIVNVIEGVDDMNFMESTTTISPTSKSIYLWTITTSVIILVIFFVGYITNGMLYIKENSELTFLGKIDRCSIYVLDTFGDKNDISNVKKNFDINECIKKDFDIFFDRDNQIHGNNFIVSCLRNSQGYMSCTTKKNITLDN
ncbi:transcriptional regulator [Grimontella sp. AG753]|nr:transcriptional regulator [Grimontella sp. AG753]